MLHVRDRAWLGVLSMLLLAYPAMGQTPAKQTDAKAIAALIAQLGSADFQERQAATQSLEAIGRPALERPSAASVSRRVLVVDDNVPTAEMLAMLLRMWGHEVRLAYDGPAALKVAAEYRPELVLLDIGLPRLNGYEVARRLRRQPGLDETVLVALTGYGQEKDRRRSQEAGFDHHLTKPVDPDSLQALVAASMRAH